MQRFIVALYYDTTMPEYPWPSNVPVMAEKHIRSILGKEQP
jgi:hypothetical protein